MNCVKLSLELRATTAKAIQARDASPEKLVGYCTVLLWHVISVERYTAVNCHMRCTIKLNAELTLKSPQAGLINAPHTPLGTPMEQRSSRSRGSKGVRRSKGSRGRRAGRGGTADDDDDVEEVEAMTRHEELVYWYTYFEDPNCLAVIELVATVVDHDNSIQVFTKAANH